MILGRCLAQNARRYRNRVAVVDAEGRSLTHSQLHARVNQLANALLAAGIGKGARLAILDRNSIEYLEAYFAAGLIGAWLVPVNFQLKPTDIAYRLAHSGATALLVGAEFVPVVEALGTEFARMTGRRIWTIGAASVFPSYEGLITQGSRSDPAVPVVPEDILYLGYTSGTTGSPKAAMISHRAIVVGYLYKALDYGLTDADVSLCPGPFWHSAPRDFASLAIYLGGTCVVMRGFDAREYFALVENYDVTYSFLVPTMLQMLTALDDGRRFDTSSLRALISGGSPLPTPIKDSVLARFGPILSEFYGATETRIICSITSDELARRVRSVGRPIRDVEVRTLGDQGHDVPTGQPGEVFVRGPGLFSGYYNDPERTAKSFRGDWFSLGDIGRLDGDGYLYLVDRKQDMIISAGENIYPNEIEEVLLTVPGVQEAAAIGIPDETWGERVMAVIVPAPGATLTAETVIAHCSGRLPTYMKPRRVEFADSLPRNETGKILRRALRDPYWHGAETNI